jgi:hypothetical protein
MSQPILVSLIIAVYMLPLVAILVATFWGGPYLRG